MDRVETLLQQLQQQFTEKAAANQLLLTVQMMQYELLHLQSLSKTVEKETVVVSMPLIIKPTVVPIPQTVVENINEPEKTLEVLMVDEAEVAAELEQIKRNAIQLQQVSTYTKPPLLFDLTEDDIPTLAQKPVIAAKVEVNQSVETINQSVNDILKAPVTELSERLIESSIKDLKKAIGINDRFLYINELFRGDEVMYERSIKTINSFSIWPEAEYWIRRELKTKLGWVDAEPTVKQFDQLVKRRFT